MNRLKKGYKVAKQQSTHHCNEALPPKALQQIGKDREKTHRLGLVLDKKLVWFLTPLCASQPPHSQACKIACGSYQASGKKLQCKCESHKSPVGFLMSDLKLSSWPPVTILFLLDGTMKTNTFSVWCHQLSEKPCTKQ